MRAWGCLLGLCSFRASADRVLFASPARPVGHLRAVGGRPGIAAWPGPERGPVAFAAGEHVEPPRPAGSPSWSPVVEPPRPAGSGAGDGLLLGAALLAGLSVAPTLRRAMCGVDAGSGVDSNYIAEGNYIGFKPVDDKKKERRRLMRQDSFFKNMGAFQESKEEVNRLMLAELKSNLVEEMTKGNYEVDKGEGNAKITFRLAQEYGMCWGAERSIELALAATKKFPGKKKHITNELLHNPSVNQMLKDGGIEFIEKFDHTRKDFSKVEEGDVVILPAFGASIDEMQLLEEKGVTTIDTTCPWVSRVWNVVDKQVQKDMTTVIHGKYKHEEAIATASWCEKYIMVKDINEAEYLCNYILSPTPEGKQELLEKFKNAISAGFDPDVDLQKIGVANQTTMYKRETTAIGKMLETTMLDKYGPDEIDERFNSMDTICDATQVRQDAITDMCENAEDLDFFVVVGGYDSSNTAHLVEIPDEKGFKVFHVNGPECIRPDNSVSHRNCHDGSIEETFNWLPTDRPIRIGITSGASTPDSSVQDVVERIVLLKATVTTCEED